MITCSPTTFIHLLSPHHKLSREKGEESTGLPGSSIMTPVSNMLLFLFFYFFRCRAEFPLFTRCFEEFRERALPSSFSKRLLVSFHSDFRQVFFCFFYGAGQCAYCIYIFATVLLTFCCYFDFVLLVLRLLLPYYFHFISCAGRIVAIPLL